MKGVRCPDCKKRAGTEIEGELLGPEVRRMLECKNCGHTWDVVV